MDTGNKTAIDITDLLKNALMTKDHVCIPSGHYTFSETLKIRPNCTLELSQRTILEYINNLGDCICLGRLSSLKGGFVKVPPRFSGRVLYVNSQHDKEFSEELLPVQNGKNDTLTHLRRYIRDIEIQKFGSHGFSSAETTKDVTGTAIALVAEGGLEGYGVQWGTEIDNVRIQGAFEYGVIVEKKNASGQTTEPWIHDTILSKVYAQHCKVFVKGINAHNMVIDKSKFQPQTTWNGTKYVTNGILLVNSDNVKVRDTTIWDYHVADTSLPENTMVRLEGVCNGFEFTSTTLPYSFSDSGTVFSYENITSALTAKLSSAKGKVFLPNLVFYKNGKSGNFDYNTNAITKYDSVSYENKVLPVEYKNPYIQQKALYKVGYFMFGKNNTNDDLTINSITMTERNDRVEYAKTNLYFSTSDYKVINSEYFSDLLNAEFAGVLPLYYYTYDITSQKVSIFKLIPYTETIANVHNNYLDVRNSRFFFSDFKFIGVVSEIDMESYTIIQPKNTSNPYNAPLVAGQFKFSTKLNKPVWVGKSATFNKDGSILSDATFVDANGNKVKKEDAFN